MWQERLTEFITLLVVINPFGVLPAFLAAVGGFDRTRQRHVATIAVVVSFAVLVFFIIAGGFLLEKMGVPLRAFQISGGIVLFVVALGMVQGETHVSQEDADVSTAEIAIYPLAIPKIAGPGAMLSVILLTDDDRFDFIEQGQTILVLAVVLLITWLVLLAASPIARRIGPSGTNVIGRVMGIVLASLAVNMVLSAVVSWLNLPKL